MEAGEAVPWTKPADLPFEAGQPLPPLGGLFKDKCFALWADRSVRSISRAAKKERDEELLRAIITRNGGETVDLSKL